MLALLIVATAVAPLHAQSSTDSLEARLRRAEQAVAALQQQVSSASATAVQSRSRARLELHGRVMLNAFANSRRVNNVDNPQFVLPDAPAASAPRGVGMAMRETSVGVAVDGLDALGGAFAGDIDVDFYGGQMASSGGRTFPLLRLRTARGFVRWKHAELMIGQESPLISRLSPVTAGAFGTPAFAASGNLWLWLPQARARVHSGERVRVGAEAAVLAPTSGDAVGLFDTDYDVAEASQRPYVQGRAFVGWGEDVLRSEIGCGLHRGWLLPPASRKESRAAACDAQIPVLEWLELRGEWFSGQGVRGLGGGGIGQNFGAPGEPLRTSGGWAQVNARPGGLASFGAGCGVDHPEAGTPRWRNDSCAGYLVVRPAGPLFVGSELRRMRTEYVSGRYTNDHVTVSLGWEF